MKFGDLTFEEIQKYAHNGCLVIVPTGCIEQHGPHLPVDLDTWLAEHICLSAARRLVEIHEINALVLPALPFGPTPEHRGFRGGYIDLPQDLHEKVIFAVLKSLAEQGFSRIVLWRGCGQHRLSQIVAVFNEEYYGRAHTFLPEPPYHPIWMQLGNPENPGGHADAFETSLALHLRTDVVRKDLISNPNNSPVDWNDPNLDFSKYTTTGVIGDPTEASADLGFRLWEEVLERVVMTLYEIASSPIPRDI